MKGRREEEEEEEEEEEGADDDDEFLEGKKTIRSEQSRANQIRSSHDREVEGSGSGCWRVWKEKRRRRREKRRKEHDREVETNLIQLVLVRRGLGSCLEWNPACPT